MEEVFYKIEKDKYFQALDNTLNEVINDACEKADFSKDYTFDNIEKEIAIEMKATKLLFDHLGFLNTEYKEFSKLANEEKYAPTMSLFKKYLKQKYSKKNKNDKNNNLKKNFNGNYELSYPDLFDDKFIFDNLEDIYNSFFEQTTLKSNKDQELKFAAISKSKNKILIKILYKNKTTKIHYYEHNIIIELLNNKMYETKHTVSELSLDTLIEIFSDGEKNELNKVKCNDINKLFERNNIDIFEKKTNTKMLFIDNYMGFAINDNLNEHYFNTFTFEIKRTKKSNNGFLLNVRRSFIVKIIKDIDMNFNYKYIDNPSQDLLQHFIESFENIDTEWRFKEVLMRMVDKYIL